MNKIICKYVGDIGTNDFKIIYFKNKKKISPWFDIKYNNNDGTFNAVIEIKKFTREKMEMIKHLNYNPIKQDIKNNKLRYFEYGMIPFNYGFIPQTWEDPNKKDKITGFKGDDDPIDIVEISDIVFDYGELIQIKILGILEMIDEGETDWKVICISNKSELFYKLNDIQDVDKDKIKTIKDWFKNYKNHKNVKINKFYNKNIAIQIIKETHKSFLKKMINEMR